MSRRVRATNSDSQLQEIKSLTVKQVTHHQIDLLTGKNFPIWRNQVQMSFTARGIMNYLVVKPADIQKFNEQEQAEAYMSLIATISPEVRCSYSRINDPFTLWEKLHLTFERSNIECFISLCNEYKNLSLEENSNDINKFIMTIQTIFANFESMGQPLSNDFQIALMQACLPKNFQNMSHLWSSLPDEKRTLFIALERLKNIAENRTPNETPNSNHSVFYSNYKNNNNNRCKKCHSNFHQTWKCHSQKGNNFRNRPNFKKQNNSIKENKFIAYSMSFNLINNYSNWILDSGAGVHITYAREDFIKGTLHKSNDSVYTAGGEKLLIIAYGSISLNTVSSSGNRIQIHLEKVAFVPAATVKLLSENSFLAKGWTINKKENICRLYKGDTSIELKATKDSPSIFSVTSGHVENYLISLHKKLGHVGLKKIQILLKDKYPIKLISKKLHNICDACALSKSTLKPLGHGNNIRAKSVLEYIHVDTCGPMDTLSITGFEYFSTITDNYSRKTWIILQKTRCEFLGKFKILVEQLENQFGKKVIFFHADNAQEFKSNDLIFYFNTKGIIPTYTAKYSPHQNGVAERKNRTIKESALAMMLDMGIPTKYWAEAVKTANYLLNGIPQKILGWISPNKRLGISDVSIGKYTIFGCRAFVHIPKAQRKKLEPSAMEGIFVGYEEYSGNFRIALSDNRVIISRDVSFNEFETATFIKEKILPVNMRLRNRILLADLKINSDSDSPTVNLALNGREKESWYNAIKEEIDGLIERNTWTLINEDKSIRTIGSRLVLKRKRNSEGKIVKYKARLVAQGYTQTEGIDYLETFSPVVNITTIFVCLTYAIHNNYFIHQVDFNSAYLNAELQETIFMRPPKEFEYDDFKGKILKLNRTIYGLKQSGREWYSLLSETLLKLDWHQSSTIPCLFTRKNSSSNLQILLVYVDDVLIMTKFEKEAGKIKEELKNQFPLKDLNSAKYILGIKLDINAKEQTVQICQNNLINELISKYKPHGSINMKLPITKQETEAKTDNLLPTQPNLELTRYFQGIVGSLLYISRMSRPDISYGVNFLTRKQSNPNEQDLKTAHKIIDYLNSTKNQKLIFNCKNPLRIVGYVDSDWGSDKSDRKSISGYCIFLSNALISWSSQKQKCVALSTMEAEYIAINSALKEILFIKQILNTLCVETETPILYSDNAAAIEIANNPKNHQLTKHIDIKYHSTREHIKNKSIELIHVKGVNNIADVFTKPCVNTVFTKHRKSLGIIQTNDLGEC